MILEEALSDYNEREQWRGKVRVGKRSNAAGVVQYSAQYRLKWFLEWCDVVRMSERQGNYTRIYVDYPTFEAAKTAAQTAWQTAQEERHRFNRTRFSAWRKIWP